MAFLFFFLNNFKNFIFGCTGLCCCGWAFSSREQGLLIAVASPVAEHRLSEAWASVVSALRP